MQKSKLDVLFAFFAYGGNGGVAMQLPAITTWYARRYAEMLNDERVGRIACKQYGDIPLSMERNRVVADAKDGGFDVIVMIDSDNVPDLYLGHEEQAKPFWGTSFDFLYERSLKGLPTVVCAPYCGPPPHPVRGGEENVYVFYAVGSEGDDKNPEHYGSVRFEPYTRDHAAIMRGIQSCAAGPTGCIMYSTDAFDLMPVSKFTDEEILNKHAMGEISTERAKQLLRMESWFFYEFTDARCIQKCSTEDVTNTREIQFAGIEKHGEPIVFCNWDAWAGHYKPKCVGAPRPLRIESVSNVFAEAVRNNISEDEVSIDFDFTKDGLPSLPTAGEQADKEVRPEVAQEVAGKAMVKEMRLGHVVLNPRYGEDTLQAVRDVCEKAARHKSNLRAIVLGDETGELSLASCFADTGSVFVQRPGFVIDTKGSQVKFLIDGIHPRYYGESQELDAVIASESFDRASVLEWASLHLRAHGVMVIVPDGGRLAEDVDPELGVNYDWEGIELETDDGVFVSVFVKAPTSNVET